MATSKKRTNTEWVGGLVSMPGYVTGEGEPYRPEALLWMGPDGAVRKWTVGKPGELLGAASASLREAMEHPTWGRPQVPGRVRVSSPELAQALREGHPGLDVVCAPTPEMDAVLAFMREKMKEGVGTRQESYLAPDIGPDAVAAFFRAVAALFRAKPWKLVPSDQSLLSVTIETLGVREAVLSVIGQMGQSFGLILFSGFDDFEAYLDAVDATEHGEEPAWPPHFSLNFERGAEMSAALRQEIAEHGWEVAAANAYPWLMALDADLVARPPTADEVSIATAIALALPEVLRAEKALAAAWSGGEPVVRTLPVQTHAGTVQVTLRAPYEEASGSKPPDDVLGELYQLAQDGEEIDPDARRPLEDELVRRFAASPEAASLADVESCRFIMDFAADYFGATIATLRPQELREIIFEIIPRKVSIEASAASGIVENSRAFYTFLKRDSGLPQADACLRVLGGDAVAKLEAALSDSRNFGMAKSLFMAGREAGFDMDSTAGIEAWMQTIQSRPLPDSVHLPPVGAARQTADKAAARAKKNRRKTARKARKKNR